MSLILGIFLAILAYSMANIGSILQKKAASELPNIEDASLKDNLKNFLTNWVWVVGWILMTVQWYIYIIALPMAPISLLSAMMGVGMIVLVVFSHFYLKEPISKVEIFGTIIIIIGVAALGLTNQEEETEVIDLDAMIELFSTPGALLLTIVLFAMIIIPIIISITHNFKLADVIFGIAAGMLGGIGSIYSKAMMAGFETPGIFSALQTWQWWIFLILLTVGNLGLAPVQQVGFQKGKAVVVAPLTFVTILVVGVIGGVVVFEEWNGLDPVLVIIKVVAIIVIVVGVGILSSSNTEEELVDEITDEIEKPKILSQSDS